MHTVMNEVAREIRRQYRDFRRANQMPTMIFVDADTLRTILMYAKRTEVTGSGKRGEYWFLGLRLYEVYTEYHFIKVVV